ncbi:MAG: DUF4037 domain-containing protein [Desulfuromonadaceae bacterium]
MNGLALSERYFQTFGLPLICDKFYDFKDRIAAGLIGHGSECLGFDDEFSRDHDWGPGFCIWLTDSDYERIGQSLTNEYLKLPKTFEGFERKFSEWGEGRVGVFESSAFYRGFMGRPDVPVMLYDWLALQENYLSACTTGKVFYDPLGEFTRIRQKLLAFYPEDVRIKKMAARCMSAGQSGQYNFIRSLLRRDYFAAQYAETKFCADIMSLIYLLNRCYAPYYKWLLRGVVELPVLGKLMFEKISEMASSNRHEQKRIIMDEICIVVIEALQMEKLTDSTSGFLVDHGPILQGKITDSTLRAMDVWVG